MKTYYKENFSIKCSSDVIIKKCASLITKNIWFHVKKMWGLIILISIVTTSAIYEQFSEAKLIFYKDKTMFSKKSSL